VRFDELIVVAVIALVVLGPQRLPEYAAKLAELVKQVRRMAEGAKGQLKDQLGPEYQDVDWRQYDPRQYDPRRIVREALLDPLEEAVDPLRHLLDDPTTEPGDGAPTNGASTDGAMAGSDAAGSDARAWDPERPTVYDTDAT
jgi:sec-independent protein translocase protein TatB